MIDILFFVFVLNISTDALKCFLYVFQLINVYNCIQNSQTVCYSGRFILILLSGYLLRKRLKNVHFTEQYVVRQTISESGCYVICVP